MSKQEKPTTSGVFDDRLFNLQIQPLIEQWDDNGDMELPTSVPAIYGPVDDDTVSTVDTVTLYLAKIEDFARQFIELYRGVWRESVGVETPEFIASTLRPRVLEAIDKRAKATRDRWSQMPFPGTQRLIFVFGDAIARFEPELAKIKQKIERQLEIESLSLSHRSVRDAANKTAITTKNGHPAKSNTLTDREQKLWEVIQRGLKATPSLRGAAYCREVDAAKISPPRTGIWKDGPRTYAAAYKSGNTQLVHWIQNEKSKIRRKAELAGPYKTRTKLASE